MKVKVEQQENCSVIHFEEWDMNFYFLPAELRPMQRNEERLIRDMGNYLIAGPDKLMLLDPEIPNRTSTIAERTATFYLYVDVNRLFARLLELREKKIDTTIDLARLKVPLDVTKPLTVTQMVKHPNARGDMAKTIKFFRDRLRADQWPRLVEVLSRYLTRAKVFGHRDEFYFDGRVDWGCGFNGGFILHGDEFGIHT